MGLKLCVIAYFLYRWLKRFQGTSTARSKLSDWSDSCQEVPLTSLIMWYRCGLVFQQTYYFPLFPWLRAPWKSASAPPRGGAREPGMQLSAFHQDCTDRLPEQTQRCVYGGTARAQRRGGGIIKIFHWEGEPQRELDTATTMSFIYFIYSNHGITYL